MLQTDSHTAINWLETLLIRHDLYNAKNALPKKCYFQSSWTITTAGSTQLIYTDLQIQAQVKYTLLDTL